MAQWRKTKRARNRYTKAQFDKLASGQDLVSDQEKQAMAQGQRDAAEQTIQAQQSQLNRAAQAQAGGSEAALGTFQAASQQLGEASSDAAVQATGQAQKMGAALEAQRRAETMGNAERVVAEGRADARHAQEMALRTAEAGAEVVSSMFSI